MRQRFISVLVVIAAIGSANAQPADLQMQTRIRQEGFRNSKIMEYAQHLTDVIGARLTGSPNMKQANDWTRTTFEQMGLSNAHLESYAFGRGWTAQSCTVSLVAPDGEQLYALAKAWSPSTNGPVRGKVVRIKLETEADLEKQKGKLAGAILMMADAREMKPQDKAGLDRYDDAELAALTSFEIPPADRTAARISDAARRRTFRRKFAQFTIDEKIAAIIDVGSGDGGVFRVQSSGTWRSDEPLGVPSVGLAPEHYNRLSRMIDKQIPVELEVEVKTTFHDQDLNAYNTIAEIPGGDRKNEVVMLGAHLDSWHTGTGATDNAAGSVVMMEAMRIIKSLGVTPRRTIRVALWSGEEQGLLGSRAYVSQHLASRAEPKDPEQRALPASMRTEKTALTVKPAHARLVAYYNLDNGTGKIRGIWAQENTAVVPVFTSWIDGLKDLGATVVAPRNTGSTDHIPFDEVGIPGFQFLQDNVEYFTRTHHTNWDTYERLQREDLMQAAVVVATFVWETANRPEMLPRKPMPKE